MAQGVRKLDSSQLKKNRRINGRVGQERSRSSVCRITTAIIETSISISRLWLKGTELLNNENRKGLINAALVLF